MNISKAGTEKIIKNLRSEGQTSRADYIEQLQTKLAESEARVGRLEGAINNMADVFDGSAVIQDAIKVLNETPAQSLQHIEAAAVEKASLDFQSKHYDIPGGLVSVEYVSEWLYKEYTQKLRQQQTNGE